MPLTNDFKPFATDGGANVENQAAYAADPTTGTGFTSGVATSQKLNKVWRQSSFVAALLQQFVAETLNSDSLDDGDLAAHVVRFRNALAAGATNPIGLGTLRGARASNNAVSPNTKIDVNADQVALADSAGHLTLVTPSGAITCDAGAAGPVANGRDQAGAFGNSTWLYAYLIYKPSTATLATLISATPPESFDGSTLPTLYTSWAFVEPVYKDGSGNLLGHKLTGSLVAYEARQIVLNQGQATAETAFSLAAVVPPRCDAVLLDTVAERGDPTVTTASGVARLRWKAGKDFKVYDMINRYSSTTTSFSFLPCSLEVPGVQQLLYAWDGAVNNRHLSVWVTGFRVRNGS